MRLMQVLMQVTGLDGRPGVAIGAGVEGGGGGLGILRAGGRGVPLGQTEFLLKGSL